MFGIRGKLLLGFCAFFAIIAGISIMTMHQFRELSKAFELNLQENCQSVISCLDMMEALEKIDRGSLLWQLKDEEKGRNLIHEGLQKFDEAFKIEKQSISVEGEESRVKHVEKRFNDYRQMLISSMNAPDSMPGKKDLYFKKLLPLQQELREESDGILKMNQDSISRSNEKARHGADMASRRLLIFIFTGAVIAIICGFLVQRWILDPVRTMIASANEIRNGNLDLLIESQSADEIGQLSEAFNAMAEGLRQVRRSERMELLRTRQASEDVFQTLPVPVAVFDTEGRVELLSNPAAEAFLLKEGSKPEGNEFQWLTNLITRALAQNEAVEHNASGGLIQRFINNKEHFFRPLAIPIPDRAGNGDPAGVTVIFGDVTREKEQQELKSGVVATVSHQLKTPLTSLRMSVHLLLDETIGDLNDKQTELLLAAREDCERLVSIIHDLLDINRMKTGKELMEVQSAKPETLIRDALSMHASEAKDKGVFLKSEFPGGLPEVTADTGRISHAFGNLISNALHYTGKGGTIILKAEADSETVSFSVSDNGPGIPSEYISRVFEPFFRVPGQEKHSGAGLGLAIVREIVEAHGGSASVSSEPGQGAKFCFTLLRTDNPESMEYLSGNNS